MKSECRVYEASPYAKRIGRLMGGFFLSLPFISTGAYVLANRFLVEPIDMRTVFVLLASFMAASLVGVAAIHWEGRKSGTSLHISGSEVRVVEWYGRKWSFQLQSPVTILRYLGSQTRYLLQSNGHSVYIVFPTDSDREVEAGLLEEYLASQGLQVKRSSSGGNIQG